jgi:predicted ATP-binding protein involved in virulence
MSKISNIKIENVKGFGTIGNSFDIDLFSGKINILVAPNGFGKSSITTAFGSLNGKTLSLSEDHQYHNEDSSLAPLLSITENGNTYVSNATSDQISNNFTIYIINNPLTAKAIGQNMGKFVHTYGYMDIKNIEICKVSPRVILLYHYNVIKKKFGGNGKILLNIQSKLLFDNSFVASLGDLYSSFEKFKAKSRSAKIDEVISYINSLVGSRDEIKGEFDAKKLTNMQSEEGYKEFISVLKHVGRFDDLDTFGYFYQLFFLYKSDTKNFKNAVKYSKYCLYRDAFNNNLKSLDTTWKDLHATEEKDKLVINFPKADEISYGQRDALSLCVNLQILKADLEKRPGKYIIIIDEVFDYLDAMNLTLTQYYLSTLVRDFKSTCVLYPIIMTHLDPQIFIHYAFRKMKVIYLIDVSKKRDPHLRMLLSCRNNELIKDDVSHFLLHYAPDVIAKGSVFEELGLPKEWGENLEFMSFCSKEMTNYLNDRNYDPYAVCTALRVRVEKLAYDELDSIEDRKKFVDTHGTKYKLDLVDGIKDDLPEVYYMLGIIYNDTEHLYLLEENEDKPVIYRLNNDMIKNAIKRIFDNKTQITITDLH